MKMGGEASRRDQPPTPHSRDASLNMKAAPAARMGLLGVTCVTLAGLFALNTRGEGVTKAAKRLWKAPEKN